MNSTIVDAINYIVQYATNYLMPFLLFAFVISVISRIFISVIVRRQKRFVEEFCKRVYQDIWHNPEIKGSFYDLVKRFLARTYFESFELRAKYKRRNKDHVMTIGDRAFLIQDGIIVLIDDFLKHVRYLRKDSVQLPNFHEISNNIFSSNPVFNRMFGMASISRTNEILNIMPGIFIVAGIFGTFLGIMKALPELTGMDITNAMASKVVIDSFLIKISFALTTSILGIILSISMSFLNSLLSPENTYIEIIDSFKSATNILWNKCEDNEIENKSMAKSTRESEAEDAFELAIANMYSRRY
ncbi:MAG: hypothetical protein COA99_04555 [Moraxellaceae bacterium]|nr:MAG: hypothetical protein COA99_04555 [Moraxellaceae bacterium]